MKQKRSDITPMDEDTPNTWKTVMSKSAKVAGDVAKQLVHGNDSDGVWSSDEDASGDEVEFVKQTRLFVRSTSSSSDDNDDSVQILGVKNAEKTNYYADLMAPTADYGTGEDEDEEDDDDDDDSTKKKITKTSKNINDEDSYSSSSPSSSDSDTTSDASSRSNKNKQKKNKNNKNSRGYKPGEKKGSHKKTTPMADKPTKPMPDSTATATSSKGHAPPTPAVAPTQPYPSKAKLPFPRTPTQTQNNSANKTTMPTPTLKQTNLKHMFTQAAYHVLNKVKEKVLDDTNKTLTSLPGLLDGEDPSDEESETELPMKPPATGRVKQRKELTSPAILAHQKNSPDLGNDDGWSEFEIDDADLNLSASGKKMVVDDAMDIDTTYPPKQREAKYKKGLSQQQRKFIERKKKAGDERGIRELLQYCQELETNYVQVRDEQQCLLQEAKDKKTDGDLVSTISTAGLTNDSRSIQGNTTPEAPGTPRC